MSRHVFERRCKFQAEAVLSRLRTGSSRDWDALGDCVVNLVLSQSSWRLVVFTDHSRQKSLLNCALSYSQFAVLSHENYIELRMDQSVLGCTEIYHFYRIHCKDPNDLLRLSDILTSVSTTEIVSADIPSATLPPLPATIPSFDLSCLIDNPSLPRSVSIRHTMTGKKWKLHESVLLDLYPSISIEKLKNATKNSGLPLASIEAFIGSLYHKPLPTGDWRESSKIWFHTYYLWRQTGLATEWLLDEFSSLFVSKLPAEDACWALIDAWNDESTCWKADDAILACLLTKVKTSCLQRFAEISATVPSSKNVTLLSTLFFSKDSPYVPQEPIARSGLPTRHIQFFDYKLPGSSEFAIGIRSKRFKAYNLVNPFHLYARWSWFRRLMDVPTCVEAQSRTATLPAQFTANIISAILESLLSEWRTFLSEKEALTLLEVAGEYGLTDLETGKPLPEFKPLMDYCEAICFPPLTSSNQLMVLARHHRLRNASQIDALLQQIVDSGAKYTLHDIFDHLSIDLCSRLRNLYKGKQTKTVSQPR